MQNLYTAVSFDMRAPAFGTATADLYAAALEMAAYADDFGIDRIGLMEHHASEDGYLPTPFVLGGGIAARTRQCRMTLGAVILPLHDPVKIAEQAEARAAADRFLRETLGAENADELTVSTTTQH